MADGEEGVGTRADRTAPVDGRPMDPGDPSARGTAATGGTRRADRSLAALLETAAGRGGGLQWIDETGRVGETSFASLHAAARRVSGALAELGVAPGDRVALVAGRADRTLAVFFGVLARGAVAVLLAPPGVLREMADYRAQLERRLARARPAILAVDGPTTDLAGPALAAPRAVRVETLLAGPDADPTDTAADALALIQFSSGTGGPAKPVALRCGHLLANARAIAERGRLDASDRIVSWLPLFHDMGLIGGALTPIACGASLVLMAPAWFLRRPEQWLRAIADTRATVSAAPSFGYAYAVRRIPPEACAGLDLRSWRLAWNGAETVRAAVIEAFIARFAPYGFSARAIVPTYGLAEATLCVAAAEPGAPLRTEWVARAALRAGRAVRAAPGPEAMALVSVGRPLCDVTVTIDAPEGRIDGEAPVGEILVRGPSVMAGYLDDPEASARVLREGWLRTGDLGYVRGGELFVCGRRKETVVLRGVTYHAVELETAIDEVPGTRPGRAVVFDEPGESGEGGLVVVCEIQAGAVPAAVRAGIVTQVHGRLGVVPSRIVLVAAHTLPVTTSGKLRRQACRDRYRHGPAGARGGMACRLVRVWRRLCGLVPPLRRRGPTEPGAASRAGRWRAPS